MVTVRFVKHDMKIVIVTKIPSPYQVELFDRLTSNADVSLTVIYLRRKDSDRSWGTRPLNHKAYFLNNFERRTVAGLVDGADLVVFSWYRNRFVRALIASRARCQKPWCFWGERPGFKFRGLVGILFRRWMLRDLFFRQYVPIWGIGQWAVDRYIEEFGTKRDYYNVPYVSDLGKFFAIPDKNSERVPSTILFSGSLIERKGVLELCDAFIRIVKDMPHVSLKIMGAGPLEQKVRERINGITQIQLLGFRDWDELQQAYASADILCAPSRHDGWGLIVIEGLAAGLPVIASSNVGAAYETINTRKNGWIVPPSDVLALEVCLREALSLSSVEINVMRKNCRSVASAYDINAGAKRFLIAAENTLKNWHL